MPARMEPPPTGTDAPSDVVFALGASLADLARPCVRYALTTVKSQAAPTVQSVLRSALASGAGSGLLIWLRS